MTKLENGIKECNHVWRYGNMTRKCAFCLKEQIVDGIWTDVEDGWD